MKKICCILLLFIYIFLFGAPFCYAAEEEIDTPKIDIEIPENLSEYITPEIFSSSPEEIIASFSFGNFSKTALAAAKKVFPEIMSAFLGVLGLIIVSAVMAALRESVTSGAFGSLLEYVSVLCIASAVFSFVSALFTEFEAFISQINSFMISVIPAVCALMLAGGQVTGSLVFGTVLSGAVTLLETLCASLVLPMLSALLCVNTGSKICGGDMLGGFAGLIKGTMRTVLSFCAVGMGCVLAFQSVIAKSTDTAAVKGVKFVLGNAVPVVGGALADAAGTLTSSLGILKSTVGIVSAAVICLLFALPIIKLLLWKLLFDAAGAIAKAFSLKKESSFFGEMSEIIGFLAATGASVAIFFIIALTAAVAA
jgi:stage III sporulation protein AE